MGNSDLECFLGEFTFYEGDRSNFLLENENILLLTDWEMLFFKYSVCFYNNTEKIQLDFWHSKTKFFSKEFSRNLERASYTHLEGGLALK